MINVAFHLRWDERRTVSVGAISNTVYLLQKSIPQRVIGWRRNDGKRCLPDGVNKLNFPRMEVNGGVVIGTACAILDVAFDGASNARERGSNLMVPTCFGLHFEKVVMVCFTNHPVAELAFLSVFARLRIGVRLVLLLILLHVIDDVVFVFRWRVLHTGPIGFLNLTVFEHVEQAIQGLGRAGIKDYSTHRTVKPVYGANEGLSGLVVFDPNVFLDDFAQGRIAGDVALDDVGVAFVYSDDVVVFIEHLQVLLIAHDDGVAGFLCKVRHALELSIVRARWGNQRL